MAENENTSITPEHTLTDEEVAAQDQAREAAEAARLAPFRALRRKMDVARQAGVHTFLAPWSEAGEHAAQLGLSRLSVPVQKGR